VVRLRHEAGRLLCDRDWEGGMRETLEPPRAGSGDHPGGALRSPLPEPVQYPQGGGGCEPNHHGGRAALAGTEPDAIFLAPIEPEKTRAGRMVGGGIQAQVGIFTSFLQERALL